MNFFRFLGIHVCRMVMRNGKSKLQSLICENEVSVREKHDLPTQLPVCCFFVAFFSNSDTESLYVIRFEQTKRNLLVTYYPHLMQQVWFCYGHQELRNHDVHSDH